MKNGKKPTVAQCKFIELHKLDPSDWYVVKNTPDFMELQNKHFNRVTKKIPKRKDGNHYG